MTHEHRGTGVPSAVERAREASSMGEWSKAYATLREVDQAELGAAGLEALADAAWWMGETDESLALRQKAYAAYAAASQDYPAAALASRLAIEFYQRGTPSVGSGWLARAQRHVRELPDSVGHGYLAMVEATIKSFTGDLDVALELARNAVEIGKRFGDRDLLGMAIHVEGLILVASGRIQEGVAMLDDAMTSVIAGELTPFFTGIVYCNVLSTCLDLGDLGRAREWAEASRIWCDTLPPESPYPGLCRVSRAVVARLSGAWDDAEAEALRAAEQLTRLDGTGDAGHAFHQVGEIRRQRGDLAGAEEAFARAKELGTDALPGLALLRLAQGRPDAAAAALRGADPMTPPDRARILAAAVEVALAANDMDGARERAGELDELARAFPAPSFEAAAITANGFVLLAKDPASAIEPLRRAVSMWHAIKLPYETARVRAAIGRALLASGDVEGGELELRAALGAFEQLGAAPDAAAAAALLEAPDTLPAGLTAREAEVLRLLSSGRSNRDIAIELVISEHTVGRHLQNIYAKIGVSTRAAATKFAFEHGLV